MGPGDNSNPGVYFLIGSGTPGVYTRSGVYLDPALKRSYTVLQQSDNIYKEDLDRSLLSAQLQSLAFVERAETTAGTELSLAECLKMLRGLSPSQKSFFSKVCQLAHLILVMPATNAVSERTFSTMRRLTTYLRSTMCQDRLNTL